MLDRVHRRPLKPVVVGELKPRQQVRHLDKQVIGVVLATASNRLRPAVEGQNVMVMVLHRSGPTPERWHCSRLERL